MMYIKRCLQKQRYVSFEWDSKNSKFYDTIDKKVIGKEKGETKRASVAEFVGLKSRICSYLNKT